MFSSIAARYDRANRLLSFRQDKRWRAQLVRWANPQSNQAILDLCTGTGDLAIALAQAADVQVTGIDISDSMLELARQKTERATLTQRVQFTQGDVLTLPYPNNTFDVVTIAFGLRNLPDYAKGLTEMARVLKPDGQAFILEFSKPKGIWGNLYLFYLKRILPRLGGWITGQRAPYEYLHESIRGFPGREDLDALLKSSGYSSVSVRSFLGGAVLIHRAVKAHSFN